jgi:hypothetical protein
MDNAEMSIEDRDILEAIATKVEDKHNKTTINANVGLVSLSNTIIIKTTIISGRSIVLV